ncbi:calcium/sodium antiporter [Paracoccus sp. 1_MG-2023]|uniref:calcium/sodium antiporter n=1 Tax=unclassified Paracoccus (in: a-proteobacteria) TaxID=2688777 RepID=UPI001C080B2B|nr:calcium/sodium antiporter [Paracoccus sp. 1_MG-2023]MBU2956347.1 calcium/sodium antiporter [Paracoccus sp. C2R09]MDO6668023.1 calcium/sodium antiporter [Paracoccus sp. 1_MG-2023]
MIVEILLVLGGLILLVVGGDLLVKGAVNLALRLGITPLVVGLTVVAFGTSAPELLVSLSAALKGSSGIALGNVVGSNVANVLVILGATALISGIPTRGHDLRESWAMMMGASVLLIALAFTGIIGRVEGLFLLAALALILWRQLTTGKAEDVDEIEGAALGATWPRIALWLVAGLITLPLGANLLVAGATEIALAFGISDTVIGLTLVAIGTSLPELAASVASAMRGRADMALGNVVGSNIFNLLAILGITSVVAPLPVPPEMLRLDLWVMLASSALLMPFLFRGIRIGRVAGALLLACYGTYAWILL